MNLFEISPYIRFSAKQNFTKNIWILNETLVNLDHRFYYCVSGKGLLKVDGVDYLLTKHSFITFRSGSRYSLKTLDDYGDFICITCNFDFFQECNSINIPIPPIRETALDENVTIIEKELLFDDNDTFNNIIFVPQIPEIIDMAESLVTHYETKNKNWQLFCKSNLMEIFISLIHKINKTISPKADEQAEVILDYIRNHYKEDITNETIGNLFFYHKNYASFLVYKKTGFPLHKYLLKYRLEKAYDLLIHSNLTINEICQEVNINDPHYFSRVFKKYYLESPRAIRNNPPGN